MNSLCKLIHLTITLLLLGCSADPVEDLKEDLSDIKPQFVQNFRKFLTQLGPETFDPEDLPEIVVFGEGEWYQKLGKNILSLNIQGPEELCFAEEENQIQIYRERATDLSTDLAKLCLFNNFEQARLILWSTILAHEMAHKFVFQLKGKILDTHSGMKEESFADCFAGVFIKYLLSEKVLVDQSLTQDIIKDFFKVLLNDKPQVEISAFWNKVRLIPNSLKEDYVFRQLSSKFDWYHYGLYGRHAHFAIGFDAIDPSRGLHLCQEGLLNMKYPTEIPNFRF